MIPMGMPFSCAFRIFSNKAIPISFSPVSKRLMTELLPPATKVFCFRNPLKKGHPYFSESWATDVNADPDSSGFGIAILSFHFGFRRSLQVLGASKGFSFDVLYAITIKVRRLI